MPADYRRDTTYDRKRPSRKNPAEDLNGVFTRRHCDGCGWRIMSEDREAYCVVCDPSGHRETAATDPGRYE